MANLLPALGDIKTAAYSTLGYALAQTLCVQLQAWKKSFNLLGPRVAQMRHRAIAAMPADGKTDPIQLSFFSIQAIVIEQTRSLT